MPKNANIFFLYAQKDIEHVELLRGNLDYLAEPLCFDLCDCADFHLAPHDYSLLSQRIITSHIVIFVVSKHSILEFTKDKDLKSLKENLYKQADSNSLKLVVVVVEDVKTEHLPEFKGRHIIKNTHPDFYNDAANMVIETRGKITQKYAFAEPLSIGLLDLNYGEQRQKLKDHIAKNNNQFNLLNVFLIQGTKLCGHQLFVQSCLKSNGIKYRQVVQLNARNFVGDSTEDWMWHIIAQSINRENPPANNAKNIADYLFERLQNEHIVITLNDIDFVKSESVKVVQKIWSEIYTHINDSLQYMQKPLPFQVFLFLYDRSGDEKKYAKEDFRGDADPITCDKVFCILPKIKPVSYKDAEDWLEWIVGRNDKLVDLRPHLKADSLVPQGSAEIPMKTAITNVFESLSALDDTLNSHKIKCLNEWFPHF